MGAGVTDRLWSVEDSVALWEAYEQRRAERAAWTTARKEFVPVRTGSLVRAVISLRITVCGAALN